MNRDVYNEIHGGGAFIGAFFAIVVVAIVAVLIVGIVLLGRAL